MTLLSKRDTILASLTAQVSAKVFSVTLKSGAVATPGMLEALLRDIANNICQSLVDDEAP